MLVENIRTRTSCLKAVGGEEELFASCFTIDALTNKLEGTTQYKWFHYQVTHPDRKKGEDFSRWITVEAQVAIKY